jgi:hypothetical protein
MTNEMRWIGPSLLVLGLVFSTGGVAIVGQAGSTAEKAAQPGVTPADQTPAPQTLPSACELPGGLRAAPNARQQALKNNAGNKSIVLNTSGYNYAREGEFRPDPNAQPSGVPEGVLPKGATSAPPAAPQAK